MTKGISGLGRPYKVSVMKSSQTSAPTPYPLYDDPVYVPEIIHDDPWSETSQDDQQDTSSEAADEYAVTGVAEDEPGADVPTSLDEDVAMRRERLLESAVKQLIGERCVSSAGHAEKVQVIHESVRDYFLSDDRSLHLL